MSYQNTVDIFLRFFFKEINMSGKTCYKRVWHRRPPFFINGPIEDTSTPDEENPDDTSGPNKNEMPELVLNRKERRDLKHCNRKKNGRYRIYSK